MGKGLTLEELTTLIRNEVNGSVARNVEEVLAPLRQQQDQWAKQIEAATRQTDPAVSAFKHGLTGAYVRAIAASKGDINGAISWADKQFGAANDVTKSLQKALAAGDATAGGVLVPTEISDEIIGLLRPASVVRKLNPTIMPMDTGVLEIPKITGGATASYIGENENIPTSQETFGNLRLTWKKLVALVPISNDLLRFSRPSADEIVRNDLISAVAQREDSAFIRDNGMQNTPRGIRYWIPNANVLTMTGTGTLADITTDISRMVLALQNANARMIRPAWIMSPRLAMKLLTIRDANGNFAFRDEMAGPNGTLFGFPYGTTTQIPINLGGGTESELYLVDMADVIIGESSNVMIDVSTEAAYVENGVVVSAFSRDQTLMRVITHHDIGLRYDASAVVLQGVTWTP